MRGLIPVLGACVFVYLACTPAAAVIFTDWTSVDAANEVATGTLGSTSVTINGGDIIFGETNGTFTGFNFPFFCPPLATTDVVEFVGTSPALTYTVTFSGPVHNPILHVRSLASILQFSGVTLTGVCGQNGFTVSGNQVSGICIDGTDPTDVSGTVTVNGVVSSFTFTAFWGGCSGFTRDGIDIQIGVDEAVGVPFGPTFEPGSWGSVKALYR